MASFQLRSDTVDDILTERHGSGVNRLNQEAIVNASSNDVLARLEALEGHPELYESKRNANLTDEPISVISFEERFRKLLRDVSGSK